MHSRKPRIAGHTYGHSRIGNIDIHKTLGVARGQTVCILGHSSLNPWKFPEPLEITWSWSIGGTNRQLTIPEWYLKHMSQAFRKNNEWCCCRKKGHVFTTKGMILSKKVYIWSTRWGRFRYFRGRIGTHILLYILNKIRGIF